MGASQRKISTGWIWTIGKTACALRVKLPPTLTLKGEKLVEMDMNVNMAILDFHWSDTAWETIVLVDCVYALCCSSLFCMLRWRIWLLHIFMVSNVREWKVSRLSTDTSPVTAISIDKSTPDCFKNPMCFPFRLIKKVRSESLWIYSSIGRFWTQDVKTLHDTSASGICDAINVLAIGVGLAVFINNISSFVYRNIVNLLCRISIVWESNLPSKVKLSVTLNTMRRFFFE